MKLKLESILHIPAAQFFVVTFVGRKDRLEYLRVNQFEVDIHLLGDGLSLEESEPIIDAIEDKFGLERAANYRWFEKLWF